MKPTPFPKLPGVLAALSLLGASGAFAQTVVNLGATEFTTYTSTTAGAFSFADGANAIAFSAPATDAAIATQVYVGASSMSGLLGSDFTLTTDFTVASLSRATGGVSITVGFGLFGQSATFAGGAGGPYLLADFGLGGGGSPAGAAIGQLRLLGIAGSNTTIASTNVDDNVATNLAVQFDKTYRLTLTAAFNPLSASTYALTFGLYDAADNTLVGSAISGNYTAVAGQDFFGLRNRAPSLGAGLGENFATAISFAPIPEPASFAALAGLGMLGVAATRRRRTMPTRR